MLSSICDALCGLGCSVWCDRCGLCVWWGEMVGPNGVEWRSPVRLTSNVALISCTVLGFGPESPG